MSDRPMTVSSVGEFIGDELLHDWASKRGLKLKRVYPSATYDWHWAIDGTPEDEVRWGRELARAEWRVTKVEMTNPGSGWSA
jgi:hypothetical protein